MSKRKYEPFLDEQPLLKIKLAGEDAPLEAHRYLLLLASSCVAGLPWQPDDNQVWDLSNLHISDAPVQRKVVVAWLNAAYERFYSAEYEQQQPQDDPRRTVDGLYRLLVFTDAVGSNKAVLEECSHLKVPKDVSLVTQLGEKHVSLDLETLYRFQHLQLLECSPFSDEHMAEIIGKASNTAEMEAFVADVGRQIEQLLYIAYKLQLEDVVTVLLEFTKSCSLKWSGLLSHQEHAVFSQRVLEAAALSKMPSGRSAFVDSLLGQEFSFASDNDMGTVLRPMGLYGIERSLFLRVQCQGPFFHMRTGETASVTLDLFDKSTISINEELYDLHLRIGGRAKREQQ